LTFLKKSFILNILGTLYQFFQNKGIVMENREETENLGRCPHCGTEQAKVPLPESHPDYQKPETGGLKQYLCQDCGRVYRS